MISGHLARLQIARSQPRQRGKGLTTIALVLSYLPIALFFGAIALFVLVGGFGE